MTYTLIQTGEPADLKKGGALHTRHAGEPDALDQGTSFIRVTTLHSALPLPCRSPPPLVPPLVLILSCSLFLVSHRLERRLVAAWCVPDRFGEKPRSPFPLVLRAGGPVRSGTSLASTWSSSSDLFLAFPPPAGCAQPGPGTTDTLFFPRPPGPLGGLLCVLPLARPAVVAWVSLGCCR